MVFKNRKKSTNQPQLSRSASIETKIDHLGTIQNIDLKNDTKIKIENLTAQLNKTDFKQINGMSELGDNTFPRLFYGNEVICTLQTYNETEYRNIVEILDYWRQLYKDP